MFARYGIRGFAAKGAQRSSHKGFHSSRQLRELSPAHTAIVKSTAPVLAEHGIAIASHFYKRMLKNHPELNNMFNTAHQSTGAQPAALAHAVWAYAANIDNLGALTSAVSRIANKHASLGVLAQHYPIVGENLLASIKEVLGDAVDQKVLDAWTAAYQQLADVFIGFEKNLYKNAAATPGGWLGWRKFTVSRKVNESDEIISFYLTPSDQGALPTFEPGQFISVRMFLTELGIYQPRQYSLSDIPNGTTFRVSVKKESAREGKPAGRISNVLHEHVPEGSEVDVSMPFGDFTLDVTADYPVVLISGGVGITPMMSMLSTIVEQARDRRAVFVHATRNGNVHAMKDYLSEMMRQHPQISRAIFYEDVTDADTQGVDFDYKGRINLDKIKDLVLLKDAHYYLCGPLPFMQAQRTGLEALGMPSERIHAEVFGAGAA